MLKVSINGKITHVPECTCGKCIVRRKLLKQYPSLPYNNIRSINYANSCFLHIYIKVQ